MNSIPPDYAERVYAGVLGKLIGVYLGRPIEGWHHERIRRELGEIDYYVNGRLDPAAYITELVVADDDISGTFIFPRALADFGFPRRLVSEQVGKTWLNYIVEGRSALWWGGIGTATEHTAFWRLKQGTPAPRSGSAACNGIVLAEQIGGQIFVDGWALVSPGDPEQAAYFAEQAARVSHDGVAVEAARLVAAMEAAAFTEPDIGRLLDIGLRLAGAHSPLHGLAADIREWHASEPDWRATRALVEERYGYARFGGVCPVVPNHALILLALLYGAGDFRRSLSIVCAAGWDTDCNAGNLGCLLGIRGGLAMIDAAGPDWRGPVADRLFVPAADGGGAISDAVIEARALIRAGCALAGRDPPPAMPRFGFDFPGSVQGFAAEQPGVSLANVRRHSCSGGRSLAIRLDGVVARVGTPTFFTPGDLAVPGYGLIGCPSLHSGQTLRMRVEADAANRARLHVRPWIACFGTGDRIETHLGVGEDVPAGAEALIVWRIPETGGRPICRVGVQAESEGDAAGGLYLDYLDWDGAPETILRRPDGPGKMWRHAWVEAADQVSDRWEAFRISHGNGLGMLIQGGLAWRDYEVAADLTPHLATAWGLAARVGGLRRHLAVLFEGDGPAGDRVSLRKTCDDAATLAEARFPWRAGETYAISLRVHGRDIAAHIDGEPVLAAEDPGPELAGGGIALLCAEGTLATDSVAIRPLPPLRSGVLSAQSIPSEDRGVLPRNSAARICAG